MSHILKSQKKKKISEKFYAKTQFLQNCSKLSSIYLPRFDIQQKKKNSKDS